MRARALSPDIMPTFDGQIVYLLDESDAMIPLDFNAKRQTMIKLMKILALSDAEFVPISDKALDVLLLVTKMKKISWGMIKDVETVDELWQRLAVNFVFEVKV
jgi:ABC-type sulfate/molybdate transport systems ATPase subunit